MGIPDVRGERQLVLQPVRRVGIRREMMAECDKVGNIGFKEYRRRS